MVKLVYYILIKPLSYLPLRLLYLLSDFFYFLVYFLIGYRKEVVANNISNPSAWECSTCHAIHTDFAADDYAFRDGDAVTLIADGTTVLDEANNNTCINCHQSRKNASAYDVHTVATKDTVYIKDADDILFYNNPANVAGGTVLSLVTGLVDPVTGKNYDSLTVEFDIPTTNVFISSTHAGPHHGPQANVWYGTGSAGVDLRPL